MKHGSRHRLSGALLACVASVLAPTAAATETIDATHAYEVDRLELEGIAGTAQETFYELLPRPLPAVLSGPEIIEFRRRVKNLALFDAVDVGPADFATAHRGHEAPLELSFAEATDLHERDPDNLQYRTVRQVHLTFPLAGLVLLLVGLPFVVGQERGRGVERVATGALLCTIYFAVDFVARSLGLTGQIGPIYAAWFPLVLFGSLGLVLYASMRS